MYDVKQCIIVSLSPLKTLEEEFARKLDLSRSTFFEYLAYFRYEMGTDILYDKYQSTYHYNGATLYSALGLKLDNN